MTEKKKPFKATTPRGVFKWPYLQKPDYGTDKFPKPDGEYSVRLVLPQADAKKLIEKLNEQYEAAKAEGKEAFAKLPIAARKKLGKPKFDPFYSEVYNEETEEPTGEVEFRFKAKASGTRKKDGEKWKRTIPLFDAKAKPIKKGVEIWGGSEGKVSFTTFPYFVAATGAIGMTLQLTAAQIIELRQGGERSADDFGFGEEDDGYDSTEDTEGFTDESEGDDDEGYDDDDAPEGDDEDGDF